VSTTELSAEIRDFLSTRRAHHPEQAGLPAYGGNRGPAGRPAGAERGYRRSGLGA
jgi:hypothetical protein